MPSRYDSSAPGFLPEWYQYVPGGARVQGGSPRAPVWEALGGLPDQAQSSSLAVTSLHFTPLHFHFTSTSLHSTPLHSTPLHSTPLHSTPLHSTPLHSTPLHFTSLHFTSLRVRSMAMLEAYASVVPSCLHDVYDGEDVALSRARGSTGSWHPLLK